MKKLAVVVVVLAVIGVGAFAAMKLVRGGGFAAGLDNWVAQQVVRIGNAYLVPEIKFDSFKYDYPGTLDLTGVTLTAPDGTQVAKAAGARITLAEIPKMNQPIVIERIELRDAALRLIATPEGGFKGLVPFVKGQAIAQQDMVEEDVRLSRVLRIRKLSLENGSIEYDDATGAPPMVLGGLTLAMDIDEKPDQGGWYAIKTSSKVGGLADLDMKGRVNLDSFAANFEMLKLATDLGENTYGILPPQLQQLAREHEMRGRINASATGDVMLRDWRSSRLEANLDVRDFNIAWGEYKVPIETGSFPITLSEKRLNMPRGALELLGGTAALSGLSVDLATESMPTRAQWEVRDLDLQKMLRVATPAGKPPKLAGTLMTAGEFSLEANRVPASVGGRGELHLKDGRIAEMPVLQQILEVANLWGKVGEFARLDHSVDAAFDLTGEGARVTSLDVQTPVIALRGDGMVFYDTQLDLMLNGGPVEKIQGLLGKVGDVIGKVTDRLVGYRVRGTLAKPEVSVSPLGL